jgi:hypothetical protein
LRVLVLLPSIPFLSIGAREGFIQIQCCHFLGLRRSVSHATSAHCHSRFCCLCSICIFDPCTPLGSRRFGCGSCRMIMGAGRSPAHIMRLLYSPITHGHILISLQVSSFLTESRKLTYILTHDDTN